MIYQCVLARPRLLWLVLAVTLGLALALAVAGGELLGGPAAHHVLATGSTYGSPPQPPHPNV